MKISPPSIPLQQRERQVAESFLSRRERLISKEPWQGISHDLPHGLSHGNLTQDSLGLVARADLASGGEVLMNDGGYERVDAARLPLGSSTDTVVSLLKDFPLVTDATKEPSGSEATQGIAVVSKQSEGTPSAGDGSLWRLDPNTAQWTVIPFTTGTGNHIAGDELSATVDGDATIISGRPSAISIMSMVDAVVFPTGVPASGGRSGMSTDQPGGGQINQPVFIFTNNLDPVMVYPRANSTLEYEPLTDDFGPAGNLCDFRCVSVEVFADRVNFFNTMENVGGTRVRFRNRLRRTARGTADPDPTLVGAGRNDFQNFSGQGVKIKKLGNVLACYFQDGVAIVSETGQAQSPYAEQTLDERRGLLSTHGLVSISNNEHFGVFDDGWWILDTSGRWREAGVVSVDGRPIERWRTFFYSNFNQKIGHRLQLHYDETHNWVRMAVPTGDTDNIVTEQWIYDLDSDRVWKDNYSAGLSCFGDITILDSSALTWSAATQTWDTIVGSWQSFQSSATGQRLVHGDEGGRVFFHHDSFITRDSVQPAWSYEVIPSDVGRPLSLKKADRLSMEHVDSENANNTSMIVTTGSGNSSSQNTSLTKGMAGSVLRAQTYHHISDEHIGFRVSGTGPVRIRGFVLDYLEDQVERISS